MTLERQQIPEAYRTLTVAPGSNGIVWEERFTPGFPGFIDKIGIDWYRDTWYDFIIDGRSVEKIVRTIEVTTPDEYNPPFVSTKRVRFVFHNESSDSLDAGVLCSGYRARPLI